MVVIVGIKENCPIDHERQPRRETHYIIKTKQHQLHNDTNKKLKSVYSWTSSLKLSRQGNEKILNFQRRNFTQHKREILDDEAW